MCVCVRVLSLGLGLLFLCLSLSHKMEEDCVWEYILLLTYFNMAKRFEEYHVTTPRRTRLKTKRTRRRRRRRKRRPHRMMMMMMVLPYVYIYIYVCVPILFLCFFSSSRGAVLFKLVPETSFPGKRIFYGPTVRRRVADGGG